MAVPVFRTWTAGEVVTAAYLNSNIRDAGNYFVAPVIARLYQVTTQSIPNASFTAILFDGSTVDSVGGHSTVTNSSRYTCQAGYAGWYALGGGYNPALNGTGVREIRWAVNGALVNGSKVVFNPTSTIDSGLPARAELVFLNAGDYVELHAYQNSGGALGTLVAGDTISTMIIQRVSN